MANSEEISKQIMHQVDSLLEVTEQYGHALKELTEDLQTKEQLHDRMKVIEKNTEQEVLMAVDDETGKPKYTNDSSRKNAEFHKLLADDDYQNLRNAKKKLDAKTNQWNDIIQTLKLKHRTWCTIVSLQEALVQKDVVLGLLGEKEHDRQE